MTAGNMDTVSKELRKARRNTDTHTSVIREILLAKMHEFTLRIHLSEGVKYLRA